MSDYWTKVRKDLWVKYRAFTFLPQLPVVTVNVTNDEDVDIACFKALRKNSLNRYLKECGRYNLAIEKFGETHGK